MIKLIQKATASSKDGAVGLIKGIIAWRLSEYGIYAADRNFYIIWSKIYSAAIWAEKQFFTQSAALYALRLY